MPDVLLKGLSKRYGDVSALDEVELTVRDGEFFTLLGPSGCGKSTSLSSIAGLVTPDAGSIAVGDRVLVDASRGINVPPEHRNLGMVFQSYALWPHMTVAGNLSVPLKLRGMRRSERRRQIEGVLAQVGLERVADRYPHELSGGQQQRVALARSLVYSPSVILLDEPLSNLDAKLRVQARMWLKQIQAETRATTIYVTHDQTEALALSDRIAVMGHGRVLQVGLPQEIYEAPLESEVAAFIGDSNFFRGVVQAQGERTGPAMIKLGGTGEQLVAFAQESISEGTPVLVSVRSEQLRPVEETRLAGESGNVLRMELLSQSYVGSHYEYHLSYGDQTVIALGSSLLEERSVVIGFPADACRVFPEVGRRGESESIDSAGDGL